MPPNFEWFRGREAIREFLPRGPLSIPRVFVPVRANGQVAFGTYKLIDGEWLPNAIHVVTLDADGAIVDAIAFLDATLFPVFGLPLTPPALTNAPVRLNDVRLRGLPRTMDSAMRRVAEPVAQ